MTEKIQVIFTSFSYSDRINLITIAFVSFLTQGNWSICLGLPDMVNRRKYKLNWFYNNNGGSFFKTVKLGFHYPMSFLEKERWQPLPVVTITEENEEAMANKLFKKALMKVGLKPPANEQVGSK